MTTSSDWQQLAQKLKAKTENKHCADCLATDTEWASVNLGVFICINCSGVHRSMGTHISKIRSVQLDEWDEANYKTMQEQGNIKANSYWECNLFPFEKPLSHDPYAYRKRYILDKYVKKAFIPSETNTTNLKLEREFNIDLLEKKGMLTKQGGQRKTWKRRYCVLHEDTVSYFKTKESSYPNGKVVLEEDAMIMFVDENQIKQKYCFAIVTSKRNYYMYADTEAEMLEWVYALRAGVYYTNLKKVLNDPRNFLKGNQTKTVEKSGMLVKRGGSIQSLKKRYFVLKDDALAYYKSEKDLEPIDAISLKNSKITRDNKKKNECGISILTAERQFYLVAANEKEQKEWLDVLTAVAASVNEAQLIKEKSFQIHTLILNRMVHQKDPSQKENESAISPHSPLMWRSMSFHRSRPQYPATGYVPSAEGGTATMTMTMTGGMADRVNSGIERAATGLLRKASLLTVNGGNNSGMNASSPTGTISILRGIAQNSGSPMPTTTPLSLLPNNSTTSPPSRGSTQEEPKIIVRKTTFMMGDEGGASGGQQSPTLTSNSSILGRNNSGGFDEIVLKKKKGLNLSTKTEKKESTKEIDELLMKTTTLPPKGARNAKDGDDDDLGDLDSLMTGGEVKLKRREVAKPEPVEEEEEEEAEEEEEEEEEEEAELEIKMTKIEPIAQSKPTPTNDSNDGIAEDEEEEEEEEEEDDDDEGSMTLSMGKIEITPISPSLALKQIDEVQSATTPSPTMLEGVFNKRPPVNEQEKKKRLDKRKEKRDKEKTSTKKKTAFRRMHGVVEDYLITIEQELD